MSELSLTFAEYYDHAATCDLLHRLAARRPDLAAVTVVGVTPEGREILCLEVTDADTGTGDEKPGYLVHANIHSHELTTTTAALHLACRLVETQRDDAAVKDLLRRVAFYIIPRINPDGAEAALKTNRSVRSRNYPRREPNGLLQSDVDGDGQMLWLRWPDPDGDYVKHPDDPRIMIRRQVDDEGPFYQMLPEGEVTEYTGGPVHVAERRVDFNRQWPANWLPEHEQGGAGSFPFYEPEMHAIGRFVVDHPNLVGMLGFHTGGNGVLRPSATRPDREFDRHDLKLLRDVGGKGAELTGFPLYSTTAYASSYAHDGKLHGHFSDWAYFHQGTLPFEIELGNLYNSTGITTDDWKEATPHQRELWQADVLRWCEEQGYHSFVPWRPFDHPQLGEVEVGGWVRYRLANPALTELAAICDGCTAFIFHHAGLAARLTLRPEVTDLGGGIHRVRAVVTNRGEMSTAATAHGARLRHVEPVRVSLRDRGGVTLLSRQRTHTLGHLAAINGHREAEWFIAAASGGKLCIEASCPRAGRATAEIELPAVD